MSELQKYKTATWVLVVVSVILLIVLVTRANQQPVADQFVDINERLAGCRVEIAAWLRAHPGDLATTSAAVAERDDILERCLADVQAANNQLE